jgi:eukaryotic-like serine/threonine-protein kinase
MEKSGHDGASDKSQLPSEIGITLGSPTEGDQTSIPEPAGSGSPAQIESLGPYKLLSKLGEGGMGQVWLAEQTSPVRRQVAVKLIKGGWYDADVTRRFESERQALAIMDHPAIAKVFDAGTTLAGQPYFVMEYVPGLPITQYCDQKGLDTRERLELFIKTCEGVQHAHQKAIIHRDLKPSNILVTEVDGKPVPRIIDFGIAKATSPDSADAETLLTGVGSLLGTPDYMSPEQADRFNADIDTRTDVYSLGVILYEILTGCLPFAQKEKLSLEQRLRQIRELDPLTPSARVAKETKAQTTTGQTRQTTPKQLVSQLKGDLDWITMKALEKDRSRRYGAPSELAADIGRYLTNEPIVARPASAGYRIGKYIQRHRLGVGVAAGMVVLLAAFAVVQALQLRRITRERDRANRITEFMTAMFKVSNPSQSRGNDIRAREILDKASTQIDTGLAKDPELQAQMMQVMGDVYFSLGLYPQAESLVRRAIDIRKRVLGQNNQDTLKSQASLTLLLDQESRYPEAEKIGRETLDARRRTLGPEDRDTLDSMRKLGMILADEGRYAEAEKLNRTLLDSARSKLGPQDDLTASAATNLAIDLAYQDKYPEAEKAFREVLEMRRNALGADEPVTLNAMNNLASILLEEEKYTDAEKLYREALEAKVRVLGPEHPDTLLEMGNLALALANEKRYAEAESLFRETLDVKRKRLGPEHRSTLVTQGNLADVLVQEGKYAEAEQLLRADVEIESRTLGREHSDTLSSMQTFGELLTREGHYPEAEKVLLETYETRRRVLGRDHLDTAGAAYSLAQLYALEGARDEAFAQLREAVEHGLPPSKDRELSTNTELKSLHGDPRFDTLVADAEKHATSPTVAQ